MQTKIRSQLQRLPYYGVLALLIYMPFHVFLAQALSLLTGGLEVWKIGKDLVLGLLTLFAICMIIKKGLVTRKYLLFLVVSAFYAFLHFGLWLIHPHLFMRSAELGILYNLRLPELLILGWSAAILYPGGFTLERLLKIVLSVSTVVAVLGVVQYFLPGDFLTHFGYSVARGVRPAFFIDNNNAFPRVMSSLRDPNSLGAYLILPIAALSGLVMSLRSIRWRLTVGLVLLVHLICLYLTFSRSAWAGGQIAVALIVWWQYRRWFLTLIRRFWPLLAVALLVIAILGWSERHSSSINGIVSHATSQQTGQYDSNEYHLIFVEQGVKGIIRNPLGHGPGTAGLASIQNPAGSFLTENYYVQIGYEVGIVGLAVLVWFNAWIYLRLRRQNNQLAHVLLASFWSYILINMLLHMWSNEAVATQWWLLTGVAVAISAGGQLPQISNQKDVRQPTAN